MSQRPLKININSILLIYFRCFFSELSLLHLHFPSCSSALMLVRKKRHGAITVYLVPNNKFFSAVEFHVGLHWAGLLNWGFIFCFIFGESSVCVLDQNTKVSIVSPNLVFEWDAALKILTKSFFKEPLPERIDEVLWFFSSHWKVS